MRLQKVLDSIIHPTQTGFMKNRYIGQNIMKLITLVEHCNRENKLAVVISLDYEKAFDKLEWKSIQIALTKFNIGTNFKEMINMLYNGDLSYTMNNGYWSEPIHPSRGVRQGDPLSAILFAITIEIL